MPLGSRTNYKGHWSKEEVSFIRFPNFLSIISALLSLLLKEHFYNRPLRAKLIEILLVN